MKKETFEKFLENVRNSDAGFILKEDSEYILYAQAPASEKAKVIFSDYRYSHLDSSDIVRMNSLKPVAIVCEDKVYIYDSFRFRSNGIKPTDLDPNVISFHDLLKSTRAQLLDTLIPKLYDSLPEVELNEDHIEAAKEDARRKLLHSERFGKKAPLADMEKILTEDAFINVVCGRSDLNTVVTEAYMRKDNSYAYRKAYDKEVQKHIDTPVCAAWELELAEAIHASHAKTVNMTFSFNGKSVTSKIKVDEFFREFVNNNDIDWWCFSTDAEGKRVLKELGSNWNNRLYAYHIDEVTYSGKTIYSAPEEAKSLRGDAPEKEDDYER